MKKKLLLLLFFFMPGFAKVNYQRMSSFPFISGDSFRALADHIYDETTQGLHPANVKKGDVIFLKTDYLEHFFHQLHPKIRNPYILITHNSDYGAPGNFAHFLDDEKLSFWFGMSPTIVHPKFIPIPIGIANEYWPHGNTDTFIQLLKGIKTNNDRALLVGINFSVSTNLVERTQAYNYFARQPYCADISSSNHAEYLAKMSKTKFVVSPPGNSLDCHRTWEILLAGAIPIVLHSTLDPLFEGLPVLLVNSWQEVTRELLQEKYFEFQQKNLTCEKILFLYWHKKIEFYKQQVIFKARNRSLAIDEIDPRNSETEVLFKPNCIPTTLPT